MKEFGLDAWQKRWLWSPIKRLGQGLGFMGPRWTFALALMVSGIGLYGVMRRQVLPAELLSVLPVAFAAFSLVFVLKAFVEQKSAVQAWSWVAVNQFFLALAMGFNESISLDQFLWFFSGILGCTLLGLWVLNRMLAQGVALELAGFQGQTHLHPHLALLFLLAGLGLAGFPITPTFVGEDLLLDHVHLDQPLLLFLIAFAWVLDGLVIYRTYSRLFLGPDPRTGGSAPSA
jgi:formate hydrogenlyase subunit 3/multisubunit Na+/H+ antiporter MnhD subunit